METRFVTIKDGEPSMATPFSFSANAVEALLAGTIVGIAGSALIGPAAKDGSIPPVGFITQNVNMNEEIQVYTAGMVQALFDTTTGMGSIPIPVYLSANGYVTPVPPTSGEVKQIGLGYLVGATPWLFFQPQLSLFLS